MRYEELKDAIERAQCHVSGTAETVLGYVLDDFSEYEDIEDEIEECDVWDAIYQSVDDYFIYYSDAWDYLQEESITDFTEAIDNVGARDVCAIAYYYLQQEILDNLCL